MTARLPLLLAGLLAGWTAPAPGQAPSAAKSPPVFAVLNLIRSTQPSVLKLGSEPLGEGTMSLGYYSGILHWVPAMPLLVESPGFPPLRIPPGRTAPGQCPLFILQDALEKPAGGGEPKPVLKYTEIPNTQDRPDCFTDGLNLTSRQTLACNLEGKNLSLERGKRVRLSTRNGLKMQVQDGPEVHLGPFEENPGGMLLVFYENPDGTIAYVTTYDMQTKP